MYWYIFKNQIYKITQVNPQAKYEFPPSSTKEIISAHRDTYSLKTRYGLLYAKIKELNNYDRDHITTQQRKTHTQTHIYILSI